MTRSTWRATRKDTMTTSQTDRTSLWRTPTRITDELIVTGDLKGDRAAEQLAEWTAAGVGTIIDVRGEWNDIELVGELAPHLNYVYLPTHDNGGRQSDAWFANGVQAVRDALRSQPGSTVLIHCHMGVNRAPSLAFAVMLDQGWAPIEALVRLRAARPIVGIAYAQQAIDWFHRSRGSSETVRNYDVDAVRQWMRNNTSDTSWIISRIRRRGG